MGMQHAQWRADLDEHKAGLCGARAPARRGHGVPDREGGAQFAGMDCRLPRGGAN